MPESDHPFSPDHLTALFDLFGASDPTDPTVSSVPPARQQRPPDPLPDLEHDRQVLSWLACSSQLCSDVKGHLVDALLAWALEGRGYPQMVLPDAGPDCDHLQALQHIIDRFPQRIAQAETVAGKLELGRAGRPLQQALWASWDPQGMRDSRDRELLAAMPWLAGPPAPSGAPDRWST